MNMDDRLIRAQVPEPGNPAIMAADVSGLPPADVPHYLYGLARLELLKRGLFPVHAACVGRGGRFALLVGHSGDGKTSVVLNLVGRPDWRIFSGNKTAVGFPQDGKIVAVAGTKVITVRAPDGGRAFAEIGAERFETAEKAEIAAIFRVRLSDGADSCVRLPDLGALHVLYPFFLDAVNADVVLDGGSRVLSGEPPAGARERLAGGLRDALARIPAFEIAGSAAFVAERITENL